MKFNKNISNFMSVTSGQIIALLSQLIIIKVLTNQLSVIEFGLYSLIIIVPSLVLPIIFCEIATSLNRFFFEEDKYKLYFNCIIYLLTSFTVLLFLCFICYGFINSLLIKFEISISEKIFYLALLNHLLIYLGSINLSFFKINYQPKWFIAHNVLAHGLKVVLFIIFIKDINLELIFTVFTFCHFIAFCVSSTPLIIKSDFKINPQLIRKTLGYSSWLIPSSYFGIIINSCDRFIIKLFMGFGQVGVYSLGYKIGDLVRQFFITSFSAVLSPVKFNTRLKQNVYTQKMNTLFELYIFLGLLICLGINSLSKPFILLLANDSYLGAIYVIPLILSAHIIWGANDLLNSGYLLKNKTKITSLILLVGAVVNLVLNFILIPKLGLLGACLSTTIAYAASVPISYVCSIKNHFLRFQLRKILFTFTISLLFLSIQTFISVHDLSLARVVIYNLSITLLFAIILYKNIDQHIKTTFLKEVKALTNR